MLFWSQLATLPTAVILMAVIRKSPMVWYVQLAVSLMAILLIVIFYIKSMSISEGELTTGDRGSFLQDICYCLLVITATASVFCGSVFITKAISKFPESQGSLRGLGGSYATTFITVLFYWGGSLSAISPPSPWLICLGLYCFNVAVMVGLSAFKKLKV